MRLLGALSPREGVSVGGSQVCQGGSSEVFLLEPPMLQRLSGLGPRSWKGQTRFFLLQIVQTKCGTSW